MRIGVIGAGSMGGILARHLAKLGHHVSIANSRGPASLTALAAEIGATPVSVFDAAIAGEIVILAIPTKAVADLPRGLFANVPSSVAVIDVGNYHPERRDGRIDAIDGGILDSQWVARQAMASATSGCAQGNSSTAVPWTLATACCRSSCGCVRAVTTRPRLFSTWIVRSPSMPLGRASHARDAHLPST